MAAKKPTDAELDEMMGRTLSWLDCREGARNDAQEALDCIDPAHPRSQRLTVTIYGSASRPLVSVKVRDGEEVSLLFAEELRTYLVQAITEEVARQDEMIERTKTAISEYEAGKRKPKRTWRQTLTILDH